MHDVAIIGHGLTPEGQGWGHCIDATPVVVRMWNYHWQNLLDYGERYDFGFYEISPTEMARFYKHNCRTPARGWVATRLLKPYEGPLPENTTVCDASSWDDDGRRLGGLGMKGRLLLTRGVRAACWALTKFMSPGQSMVLVGFDNVYTGRTLSSKEGFPQSYIEFPAAYPMVRYDNAPHTETKSGNHDFAVEGPLLNLLAKRAGIKLDHAQDVW